MPSVEPVASRLHVGRVVRFTLQLVRLHLPRLMILSPLVAVPAAILRYREGAFPDANLWDLALALPFAAYTMGAALMTATVTRMIVPDGAGHYPTFGQSIAAVVSDLPALATIGLVSNVLVLLGIFMLVVPGLILGVLLALLIPVRTIEQTNFVRTGVRSAVLTKGNRWAILGLLIAVIVLEIVGDIVVNIVLGDPALAGYSDAVQSNGAAAIVASALITTAVSFLGVTGTAVLYCELRRIVDGPAPRELAAEFD
jgi:hypothetical protein